MTQLVRNILNNALNPRPGSGYAFHQGRLKTVLDFVDAGIEDETITLTGLGRAVAGDSSEKSRIKRSDRLVGNELLHCESMEYYRCLASSVIAKNSEPVLLVDWSTLQDKRWHLLRVSMALQGRAVTIFEQIYAEKNLNSKWAHRRFLQTLAHVLPEGCRPIIISDAGFKNPWFRAVEAQGWWWLSRIRGSVLIRPTGEEEWYSSAVMRDAAHKGFGYDMGTMDLAKTAPLSCRMVMISNAPKARVATNKDGTKKQSGASKKAAKSGREPWMLATNNPDFSLRHMYRLYFTRMQIEESFRDDKSGHLGMGFEYSRSQSVHRLSNLALLASLINFALTMVGVCAEANNLHRRFQANTVTTRRVLSFFYLGRRVVKRAKTFTPSFEEIMHAFEALATKVNRAVYA